jgi:putative ABC transport system permease protein
MFKNNLKTSWRSLKRQPFFTFLNTFGLAIGMAGALMISLYIYDELSFDSMFKDANRIRRVDLDIKFGGQAQKYAVAAAPLASALDRDFDQIELTTRFRTQGSMLLKKAAEATNVKESNTTFVDSTFFEMFGLDLLYGDTKTALKKPQTLVLTKTAVAKHYDIDKALGKSIILENDEVYQISGIIDDLPKNSFLRNHSVFMAMTGYDDNRSSSWGNNNYQTFFKLIPAAANADFKEPLNALVETYVMPWAQTLFPGITLEQFEASGNYMRFSTIRLIDIHLHSDQVAEISPNSTIQNVYILAFIGIFLLILACVNFMNLSTAQSLKRAKEVGIRKTLGSDKFGLVKQFLSESGLISFLSLSLAIVLVIIALPAFNDLANKSLEIPYNQLGFWASLIIATILLSLISGSYPAFFLSQFSPAKVLKGGGTGKVGGGNIRNSLVVFQFAISIFLIVSTLVVFQQMDYIKSKDLGFTKEQILIIDDTYGAGNQVNTFKNEVAQLGQVSAASLSSYLPTPSSRSNTSFMEEGETNPEKAINMQDWAVDFDYPTTLNLSLTAGRFFDETFGSDSTAMLINESAAKVLGLSPEEAIGQRLTNGVPGQEEKTFTIVGVLKNFHFQSLRENIGALCMSIGKTSGRMLVKIQPGDFAGTIANIENIWNRIAPGQPFTYYFLEDSFNDTYRSEQRLGSIFFVFTMMSLLIACLGLFGLAAFNAEKRTKEIGVRKVMGASVGQITFRLTVDFLKLVGVAILISLPLGWYAMNKWLEDFTFRIEIPLWIYGLAALAAILISVLTVSYQSIKAAIVNPVKSLKSD